MSRRTRPVPGRCLPRNLLSLGLSGLLVLLALSALSLPSQAQPQRPRSSDPRFIVPRIEAARYQQAQQLRPLPQVLVKFRAGVSPEAFARAFSRRANQNPRLRSTVAAHRLALTYMRSLDGLGWHLFRIPSVKALSAMLDALRHQPEVLLASPNQAVQLLALGPPSNPKWGVEDVDHTLAAYFGYDPPRNYDSAFWTYSWYLETVNAVAGWDVYPGFYPGAADRIGQLASDASRLPLVAVLDTGIDFDHPAFKYPGKANGDTSNGGQIETSLARKIIGGATTSGTANVKDIFGHGTSVAALIAAAPNNGVGLPGLGFVSRLVPIRIYDKVGSNYVGTDADLALAIQYAADAGCLLINVSARTGNTYQPVLQDAVDYAWSHGSLVIAATGNEGSGTTRRWPASLARVLSVGATVYGGEGTFSGEGKADYSNYGPSVTIFAPGGGVTLFNNDAPDTSILGDVVNEFTYLYTAAPTYAVPLASSSTNNPFNETVVDGFYQPSSDPNYGELSGTSFAAPLVTGLAALYAAKNGITQATTDGPQQILQAIQRGADRLPGGLLNGGFTNETAYGRINAASTLQDLNNRNATVGGILGVVKNGANVVSNATVSAIQNGSTVATAKTALDGVYHLTNLAEGDYTVKVVVNNQTPVLGAHVRAGCDTHVPDLAAVSVSILPNPAVAFYGQTLQMSVMMVGLSDTSVTWEVVSGGGSFSGDGLYHAPSAPAGVLVSTAVVKATSIVDSSIFATQTILLRRGTRGSRQPGVPIGTPGHHAR